MLEVCASNYQSSINAQEAGAHRIELCEDLEVGGVTPSKKLINRVVEELNIPVFVLIRPREGDFVYSESEFSTMKESIKQCKDLGCTGIDSGILKKEKSVDIERTKQLIELSKPLPFTFHRAFDEVVNPLKALDQLIDLGADRILTSGQESSAEKGIELLKSLNNKTKDKIIILPGAGVNPNNVKLFKDSGFTEVHASASGNGSISNIETIKTLLEIING